MPGTATMPIFSLSIMLFASQRPFRTPLGARFGQFCRLTQVPDSASIQVTEYTRSLVSDRGSRFRERRIQGTHDMLIDETRCTEYGLVPRNLTYIQGEAASATAMFPNDIILLHQTKNTLICSQEGAAYESQSTRTTEPVQANRWFQDSGIASLDLFQTRSFPESEGDIHWKVGI